MEVANFFYLHKIGIFSPILQIIIILGLFLLLTFLKLKEYSKIAKMESHYPVRIFLLFSPIYEEVIFRGFILIGLTRNFSIIEAVIISSVLFGLWHIKNIFYMSKSEVVYQIIYTIFFGAVMAYVTLITGNIWLAVILHYINNILAPYTKKYRPYLISK